MLNHQTMAFVSYPLSAVKFPPYPRIVLPSSGFSAPGLWVDEITIKVKRSPQ